MTAQSESLFLETKVNLRGAFRTSNLKCDKVPRDRSLQDFKSDLDSKSDSSAKHTVVSMYRNYILITGTKCIQHQIFFTIMKKQATAKRLHSQRITPRRHNTSYNN